MVFRSAEPRISRGVAELSVIDQALRMLDTAADGKCFGLHGNARAMQHPTGIPRAEAGREHERRSWYAHFPIRSCDGNLRDPAGITADAR